MARRSAWSLPSLPVCKSSTVRSYGVINALRKSTAKTSMFTLAPSLKTAPRRIADVGRMQCDNGFRRCILLLAYAKAKSLNHTDPIDRGRPR